MNADIEQSAANAMAAMAAWATGAALPVATTLAASAAELRTAIECLRVHNTALHVADALEAYLLEGGDLVKRLGLRPGRGGSAQTPRRSGQLAIRDEGIRKLAASIGGDVKTQATILAMLLQESTHPAVRVFRESGIAPTSVRHIARIIVGAASR